MRRRFLQPRDLGLGLFDELVELRRLDAVVLHDGQRPR